MAAEPELPLPPAPVPLLQETVRAPYCPMDRVEVALLPRSEARPPRASTPRSGLKHGSKPVAPVQLVQEAQKAARIAPSEQGYVGGSGEHVYPWAPGKVYIVYLTKKQGTGIFLPPGERLVSGLYLDGDAYEVETKRVGSAGGAYDAVTIRP